MITAEQNERLTKVGPGTPMGELLRRYWFPVVPSAELRHRPMRRRLLGEDLVVYRDPAGAVHAVAERCAHRGASLSLGTIQPDGIRCGYHGWLYDHDGQCIDQPAEPAKSSFKDRICIPAYSAEELGGLVFVYVGPSPAPLLPRYDMFVSNDVWRDVGHAVIPVNFMQIMEISVDPHHVEFLHGGYGNTIREASGLPPLESISSRRRHVKVAYDVFEYGIIKRRVLEGQTEEDDDWKVGHPLVFPHTIRVGGGGVDMFQIRVPIDDTHTWHVWYQVYRPTDGRPVPPLPDVPSYNVPLYGEDGELMVDYVDGQDIAVWMSQGAVLDRTAEHLGRADLGIITLRRLFEQQVAAVEGGEDPLGVIRDPERNVRVDLPQEKVKFGDSESFRRDVLTGSQIKYSPLYPRLGELYENSA